MNVTHFTYGDISKHHVSNAPHPMY